MLLLRRKFFYSDQNVDSRDPVQLNLLYVQVQLFIVNGFHLHTLKLMEFESIKRNLIDSIFFKIMWECV